MFHPASVVVANEVISLQTSHTIHRLLGFWKKMYGSVPVTDNSDYKQVNGWIGDAAVLKISHLNSTAEEIRIG